MEREYLTHEYEPELQFDISLELISRGYYEPMENFFQSPIFFANLLKSPEERLFNKLHKIAFAEQEREPMSPTPMSD